MHMSREACTQPSMLLLCSERSPCVLLFKQIKDLSCRQDHWLLIKLDKKDAVEIKDLSKGGHQARSTNKH